MNFRFFTYVTFIIRIVVGVVFTIRIHEDDKDCNKNLERGVYYEKSRH